MNARQQQLKPGLLGYVGAGAVLDELDSMKRHSGSVYIVDTEVAEDGCPATGPYAHKVGAHRICSDTWPSLLPLPAGAFPGTTKPAQVL